VISLSTAIYITCDPATGDDIEFDGLLQTILAYHPKIVPVLIFERFSGFGLSAAQPVAVILILVVFVVFILLRSILLIGKDD